MLININGPLENNWFVARSVPILDTSSDDIVAGLVQVLDRWVCLSHLVDLGVASVCEGGGTRRLMCLVGSRLLRSRADGSRGRCIESTLLQNLTLDLLISFFGDSESIVEAFRVEDSLCVLCELIAKQSTLLVLVLSAHVSSLVYVGRGSAIESPVVLVDVILRGRLGAVEPGQVGAEVGILTHAGADAEASRHCL